MRGACSDPDGPDKLLQLPDNVVLPFDAQIIPCHNMQCFLLTRLLFVIFCKI